MDRAIPICTMSLWEMVEGILVGAMILWEMMKGSTKRPMTPWEKNGRLPSGAGDKSGHTLANPESMDTTGDVTLIQI
jgi:hypothetical protein